MTGFLRKLARRLVADENRADDLVQDTCVVALRSGAARRGRLSSWLAGIMRNVARMSARTDARRRAREERSRRPPAVPDPAEVAAHLEIQARLLAALREIPEPYRSAVVARWQEGLTSGEIARAKGLPASTVRNHLSRGLALLRERLDQDGRGDRRAWTAALLSFAHPSSLPGPGTGTAASLVAKGALLVTGKKLVVAAAVLLLLVGGGIGLGLLGPSTDPGPLPTPPAPEAASGETPGPPPREFPAGTADAKDLPPPVDLDAADRDRDLFGRVRTVDGRPVAGARIETYRYPWRRSSVLAADRYDETEAGPATTSAADGTFRIRLRRGDLVGLRVTADGFTEVERARCQAGERVEVTLPAAGTSSLAVLAKDEGGRPVGGVSLHLWRNPHGGRAVLHRDGVTGEDGRCVFRNLTAGPTLLELHHPFLGSPGWQSPRIPEKGEASLEVVMPTGRTIRGRVSDADTGEPVAGARVGENWVLDRAVRTGADGRYEYRGWTGEGVSDLHVIAEGYGRQGKVVPPEGDVDFALSRGDVVSGRLVSASGKSVAGALVSALASTRGPSGQEIDEVSGRTGPDGRFHLESLRRDIGPHTLVAQAPGHGKVLLDFGAAPGGPGRIDLGDVRMPAPRAIEGKAVDESGKPLVNAPVEIRAQADHAVSDHYGGREVRRTDDLGRFRFPDLAPGRYLIFMDRDGRPPVRKGVVLPEDEDLLGVVLACETGRSLAVRVLDTEGNPVSGAYVTADHGTGYISSSTGADGRAVLAGLAEEVEVSLYVPTKASTTPFLPPEGFTARPAGQEVEVRLRRAVLLAGVVLSPDGEPMPRMQVRARVDPAESGHGTYTDEGGRFRLPIPPGETCDLVVDGTSAAPPTGGSLGWKPVEGGLEGVTGPREDLVIRTFPIATDRHLVVRVVDLDGAPVAAATVRAIVHGQPTAVPTASDGRAIFDDLPATEMTLRVMAGGNDTLPENAVPPKPRTLVPDGREIRMAFRPGVLLTGTVFAPDGAPAKGAGVAIFSGDGLFAWAQTDERGRFRCAVLTGDEYRLEVTWTAPDGGLSRTVREGARGGTGDVEVHIPTPR